MTPDAFRKLADAFDAKVQKIRQDQDAKNDDISTARRDAERKAFFQKVVPILGQLVRDDGAVAILNDQAIFLSLNAIDITDRAIARIDAEMGDGSKDAGEHRRGQHRRRVGTGAGSTDAGSMGGGALPSPSGATGPSGPGQGDTAGGDAAGGDAGGGN